MSGPRTAPEHRPSPQRDTAAKTRGDGVGEVIRWAAFSCVVVPLVLLWCGAPPAGAAGTALGLAAVTGTCRALLHRSEREALRRRGARHAPHRGRHHRTGTGVHRGGRHPGGATPVG
ncbi:MULTISPECIES: hypothetical protein [Streptomyces]|uniref:Uncharacterized protein n=1 Tax=Streptomyces thermogriseus TaxID=75292 RepID=A0ABP4DDJ1_9ACTN